MFQHLFLTLFTIHLTINNVLSRDSVDTSKYYEYMKKYGFMDDLPRDTVPGEPAEIVSGRRRDSAIIAFQMYYRLPVTGVIDEKTKEIMSKPRCGVPDIPTNTRYRGKRQLQPRPYTHLGTQWPRNRLTWKINSYTRQLSENQQRSAFYRAFKIWEDETPLQISQITTGKADMDISFERYDHGDNSPFDGKGNANGNTLAHAFQPGTSDLAGDTHFDDDEDWTLNSDRGTDLYVAAAHEFGHALGLGHSNRPESLMYPLYRKADELKLSYDDIRGIQTLYGPNTAPRRPITARPTSLPRPRTDRPQITLRTPRPRFTRPRPDPRPRITMRPRVVTTTTQPTTTVSAGRCGVDIDQVLEGNDGSYYVFENDIVHIVKDGFYQQMLINEVFESAPGQPDLAFSTPSRFETRKDKIYIVKGSSVWRYSSVPNISLDEGYPRQIRNDLFPEKPRFVLSFVDDSRRPRNLIFGSSRWWEYNFDDERYMSVFSYSIDYNFYNMPRDINFVFKQSNLNMFYLITKDRYDILDTSRRAIVDTEGAEGLPETINNICNIIQINSASSNFISVKTLSMVLLVSLNMLKFWY